MAEITVELLARMVGLSPNKLLDKMHQAGINLNDVHDTVNEEQKRKFLQFLQTGLSSSDSDNDVIRKQVSAPIALKPSGQSSASSSGIQVKVIRKRVNYSQLENDLDEDLSEAGDIDKINTTTSKASGNTTAASKESKNNKKPLKSGGSKFIGDEKHSRKGNIKREHQFYSDNEDDDEASAPELVAKADHTLLHDAGKNTAKEYRSAKIDRRKTQEAASSSAKNANESSANLRTEKRTNIVVKIPESIAVNKLAQRMSLKNGELIKAMLNMGVMATVNQVLDQDTAALVASEMGFKVELQKDVVLDDNTVLAERQDVAKLPRAPVVTIMGHVDHGKTSLLDYIRRTKVAAKEAGGITQRIGAYRVKTPKGDITFLDTPGHEAFTAMRARGAQCTDIVVLIVAADDGVMPQTVEAIQHAKAAKVPIIVAVNKIDKPGADPDRIRTELAKHEVISEQWGGDTIFQNISAKRGDGVDELLEDILMVAEMQQLTAPVDCPAKGVVLEAHLDKGLGPVAAVLVREGTLNVGDVALVGCFFGKVRGMFDDNRARLKTAGPSVPVEILGLSGVPGAGDSLMVLPSEKQARDVALIRQQKLRESKLTQQQHLKMENLLAKMQGDASSTEGASSEAASSVKTLNIVLKADLQGSVEAIRAALGKLKVDGVNIEIVGSGVGNITSSDVNLAKASSGIVIGFNVNADSNARNLAESEGIDIRYYDIIYQLLEEIQMAMSGMLAPKYQEEILGAAKVKEVFRSSKYGAIAGCRVVSGNLKRGGNIRVSRNGETLWEGEISSMRVVKDDVNEVHQGVECGIGAKGFSDFKIGDQIEQYKKVLVKPGSSATH